jgi:predicted enzyme related to lactoylglutathione lyase
MPPPINQSVTWVYTEDLDAACDFYARGLGLAQVLDQSQCRIFRQGPTGFLGVCRTRQGREIEPKGVVITFVTDDVDGWHAHLLAHGVTPDGPPTHSAAFNVYGFFARDPNGYRLEFQSFRDPAWKQQHS